MDTQVSPHILLSSGSLFHLPLAEQAAIAAESGCDGLELIVNAPKVLETDLNEVDGICPIRSLHAPFRQWSAWGGLQAAWRATVQLAASLPRAENVTLHPPGTRLSDVLQSRWFSKTSDLPSILGAPGHLRLSLENLPWPPASPFDRDQLTQLVETCLSKRVLLTLDLCHLGVSGLDLLGSLDKVPQATISNIHFSDAQGHREHVFPGHGDLDLDSALDKLARDGYNRPLTLELQPATLPETREGQVNALAGLVARVRRRLAGREVA